MLSKYSSVVGGVTRIFMSASQTEMHTLSVVSVLISGKLTDGCMHSRPLAVKRSEFVKVAPLRSVPMTCALDHMAWTFQG